VVFSLVLTVAMQVEELVLLLISFFPKVAPAVVLLVGLTVAVP